MNLQVLLPFRVLLHQNDVMRIVAETAEGSFGLLPRRLDMVAALTPGILTFETAAEGEQFVAIDQGILTKAGRDVRVSVRRAIVGRDLSQLRQVLETELAEHSAQAYELRAMMDKLETGFIARFSHLPHD